MEKIEMKEIIETQAALPIYQKNIETQVALPNYQQNPVLPQLIRVNKAAKMLDVIECQLSWPVYVN
jgi:hypothetical protein